MALPEIAKNVLLVLQVLWGLIIALQLSRELEWQFADDTKEDDNAIFFGSPGFKTVATLGLAALFAVSLAPAYAWGGYWGFTALVPAALAVVYQAFCGKSRIGTCAATSLLSGLNAIAVLLPAVTWPIDWGTVFSKEIVFAVIAVIAALVLSILFAHWAETPQEKEA